MMLAGVFRCPRQVDGPNHLIPDTLEKTLYFASRCRCFDFQARVNHSALISVAEPRFDRTIGKKRYAYNGKESEEVLLEQRNAWGVAPRSCSPKFSKTAATFPRVSA